MKKTSFLLLWFLLGLGLAGAQSSLSLWGMKLREEAKFHSLGENATLLLKNADGLKLNDLLLLTSNINDTVRLEATNNTYTYQYHGYTEDLRDTLYTATANTRDTLKADKKYVASIPAGFHLGKSKMTHAGITADGMVFFANADSIRPHNDKWDGESVTKLHNRKIYNYLYFALQNVTKFNGTPDEDKTLPTPLFATANTKIGYETVGDTLFIAYENIRMENGANKQTVSWNYQINLKTGEIGLQTKGFFQTTGSASDSLPMNMRWGVVTDDINHTLWLENFTGVAKHIPGLASTAVRMGKNGQKFGRPVENAIYQFFVDAPACVEVKDATITWSDNIHITDSKVNIKKETIWTKGQKALFVLSKHQTLSGDNLPEDGTNYEGTKTYPTAVTLGDGQAMVAQMLAPESENEEWHSDITNYSDFENLEASTTYYIHTFVFNDTCANGPLYGEPLPAKKISTLLEKAGDIQIKDIQSNSLKVVLPEADENLKYIVAYAEKPLTTDVGTPLPGLLKNGTEYTEGQTVAYREEGYLGSSFVIPFTIAKVGVLDSVELFNLRSGKGYYILVWLMREENGETSYSSDYSGGSCRTLYSLPAEVDFVGEKVSSVPIGWETSTYIYKGFDETTMQPIDVPKPHFCIQYTTTTGGEIISAYLDYNRDGVDEDGLLKAHLITSWFDKDDVEKIQTSFRVRFFSMEAESILGYTVRPGDSAIFSYQEEGDEEWTRLGVCNNKTEYSSNGSATLNMPLFQPAKNFRYRVDYYHESSEMDVKAAYFSIYSMDVAAFEYPAVTDLHTEALTKESVTIAWKAADEMAADEYRLLYKERAAEGDYTVIETDSLHYTLTGLKPKTQYAYYVYGIYGGEKGKESEVQYFRTLTDVLDTVKTPAFSVIPGEVEKGTEVVISCGTDNATIYYTTDGTNPTTGSEEYKTPIVIEKETTIKAFAVKSDMVDSKVVEGTYTVKVANEGGLLAEVKLYPNPTDGLFYVTVPEAAKVEIYTTNGTLVKQFHVAAGQTTLQLNQAGMYFVKVSVNGQFAIRKIVVR